MSRVFFFGLLPTLLNISGGGYGGGGCSPLFFFRYVWFIISIIWSTKLNEGGHDEDQNQKIPSNRRRLFNTPLNYATTLLFVICIRFFLCTLLGRCEFIFGVSTLSRSDGMLHPVSRVIFISIKTIVKYSICYQ